MSLRDEFYYFLLGYLGEDAKAKSITDDFISKIEKRINDIAASIILEPDYEDMTFTNKEVKQIRIEELESLQKKLLK